MRRGSLLAVTVATLIRLVSLEASREGRAMMTVNVKIDDLVGLRQDLLVPTIAEVDDTFRTAGVQFVWTGPGFAPDDAPPASCGRFLLTIANDVPHRAADVLRGEALGSAAPWSGQARIFYRRVASVAAGHPVAPSRILGHVISHELGHLLLASGLHTDVGIMRPAVDFRHIAFRRFTDEQIRIMRNRLATARTSCAIARRL
jgi:hypothetical protein